MLGLGIISAVVLLLHAGDTLAERLITVVNQCPQRITLYINGQSQGSLARGSATNRTFDDSFSGLMYTDVNGGSATGNSTTRVGFYSPTNYYYIVKDTQHLNVGANIVPRVITPSLLDTGFCSTDICDSIDCPSAYTTQPTSFPVPGDSPPQPPLAQCPGTDVGYTVTFCPEKTFPPIEPTTVIHPAASLNKCLDVRGASYTNGTTVQIYDCNETSAQRWILDQSGRNTSVKLAGTAFCLDAGQNPTSGARLTIQECVANSPAQAWVYTNSDGHLKRSSTNQCMDITDGIVTNGNRIQSWTCISGNRNQIWSIS